VVNAGNPDERRFEERDGGTWLEGEAVSLTRDVPTGLGWIVLPIIRDLPKESLANTLRSTRRAGEVIGPERNLYRHFSMLCDVA
jgi:hypothetical protein